MKSMVRQFIAVTFGLCLSMLFSICSFASTGYPWFKVPSNIKISQVRLVYYDNSHNSHYVTASISDGGICYIAKPSDWVYQSSSNYFPRLRFYFRTSDQMPGYFGITVSNSSVKIIDNDPQINNNLGICWASKSYYSTGDIYSMQSTYANSLSSQVMMGSVLIYHPNGTDGGTAITASDFPITFRVSGYNGQFNYAGITSDASYNATEINSNKANTAIDISYSNAESLEELSAEVNSLESEYQSTGSKLISTLEWLTRNLTNTGNAYDVNSSWTDSQGVSHPYINYSQNTYSVVNEKVQRTQTSYSGTFAGILFRKFVEQIQYFQTLFDVVWEWWYPLKASTPQYWNVYNTDTDDTELVNPSTVTYYITWYLGQLFLMNNEDTPLGDLQDSVDDIKDQLVNVENQEQSIITSIRTGIDNFAPDLSQIGSFKALSWCSSYLQQIYVALGSYGTVILIGLLLGVCMQFIGYFRYK